MNLISLAMMEHKIILQRQAEQNDLEPELRKVHSAIEQPSEPSPVPELQKSLSTSKKTFKRQIAATDTFELNTGFRAALKRITINAVQKKETRQESDKIFERVLAERKFLIDAALVKTMKTRQQLNHRDLVREVMGLVRFPLEVTQLNNRLEQLITM